MSPLSAFCLSIVVVVSAKIFAWALQRATRNGGMVDVVWAYTLGALAFYYAALGTGPASVLIAMALMGGIWGARLGTYLFKRNWNQPEDWRYAQFRAKWGDRADVNMFWFFQFQNVFTLALSASAFLPVAYRTGSPPVACFVLAGAIWIVAVVGEGIADAQMKRFRDNPANRGKVCRDGLWNWSRHPNYFFECVHWLAYVPLMAGSPWWWTTLFAPLVMAFLLMKLSGVPMLEAGMMKRKPGYAEYVRSTSALVPWPPRRGRAAPGSSTR